MELLNEMQDVIGDDVDDDVVPERVVQFLKVRKKHLLDGQAGKEVKAKERKQQRTKEQDERDRIVAGRITQQMSIGKRSVKPRSSTMVEEGKKTCMARCDRKHKSPFYKLENCTRFQDLSVPRRWGICMKEGRCFSCLNTGHSIRDCQKGEGEMNWLLASPQEPFKGKPISAGCISSAVAGTGSSVMVPAQVIFKQGRSASQCHV